MLQKIKKILFTNTTLKQTFLRNSLWLVLAESVARGFKFLLIPVATRILGPAQYGLFYYTYALVSIPFLFSDFGLSALLVRFLRSDSEENAKKLSMVMFLRAGLLFLCGLCSVGVYFFVSDEYVKSIYWIFLGMVAITSIHNILKDICFAQYHGEKWSIAFVTEAILTTCTGILVLLHFRSLKLFAAVYLCSQLIGLLILIILIRPYFPKLYKINIKLGGQLLRQGFPFLFTTIIGMVLVLSDTILIKWISGTYHVGQYQAALKLVLFMGIISAGIVKNIFPILTELSKEPSRLTIIIRQVLSLKLMFIIPIVCGGIYLSSSIITVILSSQYLPADASFKWLLFGMLFTFPLNIFNTVLISMHDEVKNMVISSGTVVLNIGLNILLIPRWGIAGSAIATTCAKALDLMITSYYCSKYIPGRLISFRAILTYVVSSIVMIISITYVQTLTTNLFILIGLGSVVYIVSLVILKDEMIYRLRSLLRKHLRP